MRRVYIISSIIIGVVVFLVVSALLARAFSVSGAEQAAVTSLVKAEAEGDRSAVMSAIDGCNASSSCRARATILATRLRDPGSVSIVDFSQSAGFSLGSTLGTARVAWIVGRSTPVVQCVRVRHAGNVLAGFRIQLLKVSRRIASGSDCPSQF